MTRGRALPRAFFARDARVLAPLLLGKVLEHDDPAVGLLRVRIVEVEAYAGAEDPGSHAYRGPTPRNATMFGPAGHLYVYFTYGMHWCANVVAGEPGTASAVLLRAAAPLEGVEVLRARRPKARALARVAIAEIELRADAGAQRERLLELRTCVRVLLLRHELLPFGEERSRGLLGLAARRREDERERDPEEASRA